MGIVDHRECLGKVKSKLGTDEFERLSQRIREVVMKTLPYASALSDYVSEPSIRLDDLAALTLRQIAHDDRSHPLADLSVDQQLQAIMSYFASSSGRPLAEIEVNIDVDACSLELTENKLGQYPVLSESLSDYDFGERFL